MNHMADNHAAMLPAAIGFSGEHELNNLPNGKRLIDSQPDASASDIA